MVFWPYSLVYMDEIGSRIVDQRSCGNIQLCNYTALYDAENMTQTGAHLTHFDKTGCYLEIVK